MGISLSVANLLSRQVRGSIGQRRMTLSPFKRVLEAGKNVGKLAFGQGRWANFLIGTIFSALPTLTWSLSSLWSMFTSSALSLLYFDWNQPDEALDRQGAAFWESYGGILGGVAGNAIGSLVCGVIPATTLFAIDENMARYVLREVGEEALEEFASNAGIALQYLTRGLARQGFTWLYKDTRRWLKDPTNPVLGLVFGESRATAIREAWGEQGSQSFTFADQIESQVEKIPSRFWQNFTEELIDEAIDACIEAGYVLTTSIEGYMARQKQANSLSVAAERVVEITPNRDNELEKIVLAGPEPEVRAQLPAVLAHHQLIESRDIGQIVGEPLDDYIRPRPIDGIRLKFQMYSVKSPPYTRRGSERLVRVTVTVPDVERTKLDWDRLRFACGGPNGYLWGRWRAHAILENLQSLTVYGGTKDEAKDRLEAFLFLSNQTIKTISITEELKEAQRLINPKLYKETTRIYPGHVEVINRERTLAADRGQRSREGNYIDKKARIDLWRGVKPPNFEQTIQELLRRSF